MGALVVTGSESWNAIASDATINSCNNWLTCRGCGCSDMFYKTQPIDLIRNGTLFTVPVAGILVASPSVSQNATQY